MKNFSKPQNFNAPRGEVAEDGYALMMVVFFTALLLIATMVAAPRILLEGKREKEKEMIWRGHQYVRGVKLYYRKMGRFPTSIDDLTKPKDRLAAFDASGLQRSDEWRGRFLAADLCGSGRTADWKSEAPAEFAIAYGRRGARHCRVGVGQ